jgi:L-2-hydroxyglutarate oxidase LhgO
MYNASVCYTVSLERYLMMETFEFTIIGAGAVGLAIASELGKRFRNVLLLERHESFGMETSSRNSEVIHAGIYYKPGSLKARLCIEGKELLYGFLEAHKIPHSRIGKIIVARNGTDEGKLAELLSNGRENGLSDLEFIRAKPIFELEPKVAAASALYSPSTGILDTHAYMKALLRVSEESGVLCSFNSQARAIRKDTDCYTITVTGADGEETEIRSRAVVNAAGLYANNVAAMAGIDIAKAGYKISFVKGEYFRVSHVSANYTKLLVYPPPGELGLGIHTVLDLGGGLKLGPNAFPTETLSYTVDPAHAGEFFDAVKDTLPFLRMEDLTPDMAGIRPKRNVSADTYPDFVIREESDKGLPGFINLIGIESPGLTASLAIGKYVSSLI